MKRDLVSYWTLKKERKFLRSEDTDRTRRDLTSGLRPVKEHGTNDQRLGIGFSSCNGTSQRQKGRNT